MRKVITAVLCSLMVMGTCEAKDNLLTGDSPCQNWIDVQKDFELTARIGYASGFADAYSILSARRVRRYVYGEIVSAISQECYRDPSQMIAMAALTAMSTFVKK